MAELEKYCEVVVVTQNVDDLHERAGSSQVIHLHGELTKARSTARESLVYDLDDRDIVLGDVCELGSQLRPHVVWFGEMVHNTEAACAEIASADRLLVVGTSLSVYPAAGFIELAPPAAERVVVAPDLDRVPAGFEWLRGSATDYLPQLCERWQD